MTLVGAEALKLVRRRGLMAWSLLLTVGAVGITEAILLILHAVDGSRHGPAGGGTNLQHYMFVLGGLGSIAAIMVGSTAGTQDVSEGVFRDLVVTGRPRPTLFTVRIPGALVVFLPMLAAGFAVAVGGSYAFAGNLPQPTGSAVGHYAAYALAGSVTNIGIAIGLAAFASSRVVVGVLIGWNVIVAQLLIAISLLGGARKFIDTAAIDHFFPVSADTGTRIAMSDLTAVLVLLGWIAVFGAAGRWWTTRRDA